MDVRCDRCETEYELEDGSVTEPETPVQCTSCGHTFVVTPEGMVAGTVPAPADWLLATVDGQTHRFRELTTLHKWIVERNATAEDRLSHKGGPWRRLADMAELQPFLDVVAQADRARAAEPGAPGRRGPGASGSIDGAASNALGGDDVVEDGDDLVTSGRQARPASAPNRPALDVMIPPEEDYEPLTFGSSHRGAKILAGIFIAGLAAVAAYAGFKRPHWLPFFQNPETAAIASAPPASPSVAAPPAPAATGVTPLTAVTPSGVPQPDAAVARGGTPSPVGAVVSPSAPEAPPAPGAPEAPASPLEGLPAAASSTGASSISAGTADGGGAPAQRPPSPPVASSPESPREGAAARIPTPDPLAATKGKSYERLVSDADRLLENGQTTKAQKLYDEALAMQPNGVAALTGSAFLQLDRNRPLAAVSLFKRALGRAPGYAPALFGLGEAYRAQGYSLLAIDYYRQYLAVAPSGPDAHAARGQLKELEGAPQRRVDQPSPSAVIPIDPGQIAAPPLVSP